MNEKENVFEFNLPKNRSSIIKVIGVGGGGGNAINYMYENGIEGVDFVVCNTDSQALDASPVPTKIQLGAELTEGLGAGSNPETGRKAAEESIDKVTELLDANTKMLFITAGMGGGTGTGAAPIIAEVAKEKGILTVGVVTIPFSTEGGNRHKYAMQGLKELRKNVDTLLVINNDKLIEIYGNLTFTQAFAKANEVLNTATKGIAEVISQHLLVNIDLNDARRVLENSGTAVMGQATASGENRAIEAVKGALDSPLLNDNNIKGAKQVLLKIVTGGGEEEIRMMELSDIKQKIQEAAGCEVNIIEGIGIDPELNGEVCVTVIATGFNVKVIKDDVIVTLDGEKNIDDVLSQEKEEVQEVISAKTEDKGQHTIFDNETELEMEETLNDPELEIEAIEKEVEIEIEEQELEQTEEKELSAEIDLDLEPQTVVIDLDDEVELPGELIPTLKQEDAIEEVELEIKEEAINDEETPPVNLETLTNKSREREDRLKNISMKLRTPSGLTALEDEPAYKRDNVELEETPHSSESEVSKYTLSEGEDNETEIKPNNSFLHDNVD
ncbi:MAG: cell division protein FtsZ [Flavobacteriales bacterium]|jgi:cell division protein FtsZ|nr:cell division protein FtsZ [Flavobacteriales bacterium]MDP7430590.1 cell division protein FtsZ [Flavobacteriales bacterium]HJN64260.1 cell division protein FtsZ [Flavobacteriales bacterium]|tara:strand:- start:626 stop:2293 length:1668 start_codon:yes stop_codon:yes gene_type:complete